MGGEVVDYNRQCNSVWISRVVRDVPILLAFVRKDRKVLLESGH